MANQRVQRSGVTGHRKAPWHLWPVGIVSLIWYLGGSYAIIGSHHGLIPGLPAEEVAYYASKPLYLELISYGTLFAGIFGSIALLARRKWALALWSVLIIGVAVQNAIEIALGISRLGSDQAASVATLAIMGIALLDYLYGRWVSAHGLLS